MGRTGARLVAPLVALCVVAACGPVKKAPPGPALHVSTVVGGLDNPWDLAFAPDAVYFTERTGTINALVNGTRVVLGVPGDVRVAGEGGMLGIAVDPDYATNRTIYTCYSSTALDNRIVRWVVAADFSGLVSGTPIVTGMPYNAGANGRHSGCRLEIGPDGYIWAGTGDAATCGTAQDVNSLGGKVLRLDGGGNPAPGNPFGNLVWTFGHRNVQGIAFRADGQAYAVEHGPTRDDEVNVLVGGANYGWAPGCPYNENVPMTFAGAQGAVWSSGFPTIAPSGATFLYGNQWGTWNGTLAVAVLKDRHLRVMVLNGLGGIDGSVSALAGGPRLRSAVLGPDGNLFITTDVGGGGGEIWRVVPG
jgi:glucose/arabinose dehydrogenase